MRGGGLRYSKQHRSGRRIKKILKSGLNVKSLRRGQEPSRKNKSKKRQSDRRSWRLSAREPKLLKRRGTRRKICRNKKLKK